MAPAPIFYLGTRKDATPSLAILGAYTFDIVDFMVDQGSIASDYLLAIDQTLINSVLAPMAIMIFRRNFNLFLLSAVVLAGATIYDRMLLISHLHSFLNELSTYHAAFGRHSDNVVSPQYGMIVTYVALLLVLLALVCIGKTRSFDRLMTAIMASSVLATFSLFHIFLLIEIRTA